LLSYNNANTLLVSNNIDRVAIAHYFLEPRRKQAETKTKATQMITFDSHLKTTLTFTLITRIAEISCPN